MPEEENAGKLRICDECGSTYFLDASKMGKLCPECSHILYGYENCHHLFENGRCTKCYWNGNTSRYLDNRKSANNN